jgi:hypothetical protein
LQRFDCSLSSYFVIYYIWMYPILNLKNFSFMYSYFNTALLSRLYIFKV